MGKGIFICQSKIMNKGLEDLCKACKFGETCSETITKLDYSYDDCPVFEAFHLGCMSDCEPITTKESELKHKLNMLITELKENPEYEIKIKEIKTAVHEFCKECEEVLEEHDNYVKLGTNERFNKYGILLELDGYQTAPIPERLKNQIDILDKFEPTKEFEERIKEFGDRLKKPSVINVDFELNEEQKRILKEMQTNLCKNCPYDSICLEKRCRLQSCVKAPFRKVYYNQFPGLSELA